MASTMITGWVKINQTKEKRRKKNNDQIFITLHLSTQNYWGGLIEQLYTPLLNPSLEGYQLSTQCQLPTISAGESETYSLGFLPPTIMQHQINTTWKNISIFNRGIVFRN